MTYKMFYIFIERKKYGFDRRILRIKHTLGTSENVIKYDLRP